MEEEHTTLDSFFLFLSPKRSMMMGIGTYQKAHHGGFVFVFCLFVALFGSKNDDPLVTRGLSLVMLFGSIGTKI
jgi:hypothetical protein